MEGNFSLFDYAANASQPTKKDKVEAASLNKQQQLASLTGEAMPSTGLSLEQKEQWLDNAAVSQAELSTADWLRDAGKTALKIPVSMAAGAATFLADPAQAVADTVMGLTPDSVKEYALGLMQNSPEELARIQARNAELGLPNAASKGDLASFRSDILKHKESNPVTGPLQQTAAGWSEFVDQSMAPYYSTGSVDARAASSARKQLRNELNPTAVSENPTFSEVADSLGKSLINTVENLRDDPLSLTAGKVAESVPYMVAAGRISKTAGTLEANAASAKAMQAFEQKLLAKGPIQPLSKGTSATLDTIAKAKGVRAGKAASAATIAPTVGLMEGGSNATDAYNRIVGLTQEELGNSAPYQELISSGKSHEEAKQILAEAAYGDVLGKTAVLASAASAGVGKLLGGGVEQVVAGLGKKASTSSFKDMLLKSVSTPVKAAIHEMPEEALQSGAGQFASNEVIKTYVDPSQSLWEGVGEAMAEGGAIGALSAGATSTLSKTAQAITTPRKAKPVVTPKVEAKKEPTLAEKAETSRLDTLVKNNENLTDKSVAPMDAVDGITHWANSADLNTPDGLAKAQEYQSYLAEKLKATPLAEGEAAYNPVEEQILFLKEDLKDAKGDAAAEAEIQAKIDNYTSLNEKRMVAKAIIDNRLAGRTTTTSQVQAAKTRTDRIGVFGSHSIDAFSDEDLDTMSKWEDMPENHVKAIQKEVAIRSSMKEVEANFTSGGFSQSMDHEMTGIDQHLANFKSALSSNNAEGVKDTLGKVSNWVDTQQKKVNFLNQAKEIHASNPSDKAAQLETLEAGMDAAVTRPKGGKWNLRNPNGIGKLLGPAIKELDMLSKSYKTMQDLSTGVDTAPVAQPTPAPSKPKSNPKAPIEVSAQSPVLTVNHNNASNSVGSYTAEGVIRRSGDNYSITAKSNLATKPTTLTVTPEGVILKIGKKPFTSEESTTPTIPNFKEFLVSNGITPTQGTNTTEQAPTTEPSNTDTPVQATEATPTPSTTAPVAEVAPSKEAPVQPSTPAETSVEATPPTSSKVSPEQEILALIGKSIAPGNSAKVQALFSKLIELFPTQYTGSPVVLKHILDSIDPANLGFLVVTPETKQPSFVMDAAWKTFKTNAAGRHMPLTEGKYAGKSVILINMASPRDKVATLLHELVHAAHSTRLREEEMSGNVSAAYVESVETRQKVNEQYQQDRSALVEKYGEKSDFITLMDYAFNNNFGNHSKIPSLPNYRNLAEMFAVVSSEPTVAEYLKTLNNPDIIGSTKNVFERIMQLAAKVLGLNTPAEQNAYTKLMGLASVYNSAQSSAEVANALRTPVAISTIQEAVAIPVSKLKKDDVVDAVVDGEVFRGEVQSVTATKNGFKVVLRGKLFSEAGNLQEGTRTVEVSEDGSPIEGGVTILTKTPATPTWIDNVTATINIGGVMVNRIASSFGLNRVGNKSQLASKIDLMTDDSFMQDSKQWQSFKDFHNAHAEAIAEAIKNTRVDTAYAFQNPLAELAAGETVPSEVVTAIAAGMYEFLIEGAKGTLYNDPDSIKQLYAYSMGKDALSQKELEDWIVPSKFYEVARHAGITHYSIIDDIGKSAFSALGVHTKGTSTKEFPNTFKSGLGTIGLGVLINSGYIAKAVLKDVAAEAGITVQTAIPVFRTGIRTVDEAGTVTETPLKDIEAIQEVTKEDPLAVAQVFKSPRATRFPLLEKPEPKAERFLNKVAGKVPAFINDFFNKRSQVPRQLSATMLSVFDSQGGEALFKEATGYVADTSKHIAGLANSMEANNKSIEREISLLKEFRTILDKAGKSEFYLQNELWSNFREGIDAAINPQSSKFFRNIVGPTVGTVTFKKPKNLFTATSADSKFFLKALAGSLGIDHEKQSFKDMKAQLATVLKSPEVQAAIAELQAGNYESGKATILTGVAKGGEKLHTLSGLIAYANYANTASGKEFTHSLYVEHDAKTSGVAIVLSQLTSDLSEKITRGFNKFGIFTTDKAIEYPEFKGLDAYQEVGVEANSDLAKVPLITQLFGSLTVKDGVVPKQLRTIAKPLTMTPMYGSGTKGLMRSMVQEQILPALYAALDSAKTKEEVAGIFKAYNDTISDEKFVVAPNSKYTTSKDVKDMGLVINGKGLTLREFEVSKGAQAALAKSIGAVIGVDILDTSEGAVGGAVGDIYGQQLDNQRTLGNAVRIMGNMYMFLHERATEAKVADKYKAYKASLPAGTKPLALGQYALRFPLTLAELAGIKKSLQEFEPAIKNATATEADGLDTRLSLLDTESVLPKSGNTADPNVIQMKVEGLSNTFKYGAAYTKTSARQTGAAAVLTHSTDAAIIYTAGSSVENGETALGVHDAEVIYGNLKEDPITEAANKAFYDIVMKDYSYVAEVAANFSKIAEEYAAQGGPDLTANEESVSTTDAVINELAKEVKQTQKELSGLVHHIDHYVGKPFKVAKYVTTKQAFDNIWGKQSEGKLSPAGVNAPRYIQGEPGTEPKKAFGSHNKSTAGTDYTQNLSVTPETSLDVFDQLSTPEDTVRISQAHTEYLRGFIGDVLNKGLKEIQLHIAEKIGYTSYGRIQGSDMEIINAKKGPNKYAPSSRGKLRMGAQEVYAHELSHGISAWAVDNSPAVREELKRLWLAAARLAKSPERAAWYAANREMLDRAFEPRMVNGKADYLHEFVAYGTTNQVMMEFLKEVSLPPLKGNWFNGDTLFEKVTNFFGNMVTMLRGRILKATGTTVDARLNEIMRHIVTVDSSHRSLAMGLTNKLQNVVKGMEQFTTAPLSAGIDKLAAATDSIPVVGGVTTFMKNVKDIHQQGNTNPIVKVVHQFFKRGEYWLTESENAIAQELAAKIRGMRARTKNNTNFLGVRMATKSLVDRARGIMRVNSIKAINSSFDPENPLTEAQSAALTYTLLKTGFESILDLRSHIGFALDMVHDDAGRTKEIKRLTAQLDKLTTDNFYKLQAQNLGYLMVDGRGKSLALPRYNAASIARGPNWGTVDTKIEKLVDQLSTLHALNYLPSETRKTASEVIRHEINRTDENGASLDVNGITTVLGVAVTSRKEAEANLFNGSRELMQKGYIADKYADRLDVQYSDTANDQTLLAKGYTPEVVLVGDPTVPNSKPVHVYVNNTGGMARWATGGFLLDSQDHHKGTDVVAPVGMTINSTISHMMKTKVQEDTSVYRRGTLRIDPNSASSAAPRYDLSGNVIGFRYMMNEPLKDSLMQRELGTAEVLSNMNSRAYVKTKVATRNLAALDELKRYYDDNYEENPQDFVFISAKSEREQDRTYWTMLPRETKLDARRVFGEDGIYVRRDMRQIAFGQREYSIRNIWDKDPDARNVLEKAIHGIATKFFGNQAANRMVQSGDFIKEAVAVAKDMIVVKSFFMTAANTLSNFLLNGAHGINYLEQATSSAAAYTEALRYQKAESRLVQIGVLMSNQSLSLATKAKLQQEKIKLEEDNRVSIVGAMIRSGALQTIEDITSDAEGTLLDMIPGGDKVTGLYNKVAPEGSWQDMLVRNGLVMRNSETYNQLRIMAQMSDFTAKYTFVQNRINRKNNPLTLKQAIAEASDLFIEYDLPDGVFTQAANDMGLFMFSKYLFRVQKTILKTIAQHPVRSLATIVGADFLGIDPSIFGSFLDNPLDRLTNPVSVVLGAMDEGVVTQLMKSVL